MTAPAIGSADELATTESHTPGLQGPGNEKRIGNDHGK
jgi:hypothetical protein